jgi:hypothetical protein
LENSCSIIFGRSPQNSQWIIARSFSYFSICRKLNGKIILRFFVQFSFNSNNKSEHEKLWKEKLLCGNLCNYFLYKKWNEEKEENGKNLCMMITETNGKLCFFRLLLLKLIFSYQQFFSLTCIAGCLCCRRI